MANNDKFLLVGNGSFQNRGCEAIVLGTLKILKSVYPDSYFVHANFDHGGTIYEPFNTCRDIDHLPIPIPRRWRLKWFARHICDRACPSLGESILLHKLKGHIRDSRAVLSVGGDNYSLDYGIPKSHLALDRYMKRHGNPLIIWGASVGPFGKLPEVERYILQHLNDNVAAIFVREEETKNYLEMNKFNKPVVLMGDPAFVMDPKEAPQEAIGFDIPTCAIGINLSPLMAKYVCNGDQSKWIEIGVQIISSIRRTFQAPIVLVPHVTVPHDNDYDYLSTVYDKLGIDNESIYLLPDHLSAPQLKWVISRFDCLIAARTHATIAGFSSYIPTISLGYSIKSIGINKLLFGHTEYLISAKDIKPEPILDLIRHVLTNRTAIHNNLKSNVPQVTKLAYDAGKALRDITEINY